MVTANDLKPGVKPLARIGLIARGIVYTLMGIMAFMAGSRLGNKSPRETGKTEAISMVEQTGGQLLLGALAAGLACYALWRFIQAITDTEKKGNDAKGLAVRARYFFSGLVYGSLTYYITKVLFSSRQSDGNSNQDLVQELLSKPFGQWLVGVVALIFFITGIYQLYYGFSEKFRKHMQKAGYGDNAKLMLTAGKIGYIARGIVWLIIGWLFTKAAMSSDSEKAGDTSDAFQWISSITYGNYLLSAAGLGFICYGLFSFIRARYDRINT